MMRNNLTVTFGLLLCLSIVGCDDGGSGPPTASELYGAWENIDEGTIRVWVFEASNTAYPDITGLSDVYRLYFYPEGTPPAMVQRGTYAVTDGHLVTTLTWAANPGVSPVGTSYANIIYSFSGNRFSMESSSAASGKRVYETTDPALYP